MDIGTAKPGAAERAAVAHHLIDIREPSAPYSVADFVRDAPVAVHNIRARGRLPLLVGGTMLYAKALREGLSDLPSADLDVRRRIEAEAQQVGWPALHARLAQLDPGTAARLKPSDSQRIQRALEIYESSGTPMSQLLAANRAPVLKLSTIALLPGDRAGLHKHVVQRFDAMLNAGFVEEVRALYARGDLHSDLPSMRSVGYRQAWRFVEGRCSLDEFRTAAIAATRQLAKRQMTWLRSMSDATVIEPSSAAAATTVYELCRQAQ